MSNFTSNAFGLDISDLSLRLLQFKRNFWLLKQQKIHLQTYNEVKVPPGYIEQGEIKEPQKLKKLLEKLIKSTPGSKLLSTKVITALPEPKTFIKVIEIQTAKRDLTQEIFKAAQQHLPYSLEEIYLDWQFLGKTKEKSQILIGAVPKNIAEAYFNLLTEVGLAPQVFEIEAAAIARSLLKEEKKTSAQAIIDFGATRTSFILCDQGTVQFTVSLPIAGEKVTQLIAKTLRLTWEEAEKAKIICGLDKKKCKGALREILYGVIEDLAQRIQTSLDYYKNNFSVKNNIDKIILCGGGANFIDIDKVLSRKLNLKVKRGNPLIRLKTNFYKNTIPKNKLLSFTTAIGLALRGLENLEL